MSKLELENAGRIIHQARENDMPILVYDTETEGIDPKKHHMIQISGMVVNPHDFTVMKKFSELIDPERPLEPKITEITGYTDETFIGKPKEKEIFPKIYEIFGENPVVIGHNVSFDNRMITAMYQRNFEDISFQSIDTCQMARELLKKGKDVKDHKLMTVASYYGADAGLSFHNAEDDVTATFRIFKAMFEEPTPETLEKKKTVPKLIGIGYFQGFRGHSRIYIRTNLGAVWWDALDKTFGSKEVDIDTVDLNALIELCTNSWRCETIDEVFSKVKKHWQEKQEAFVGRKKEFATDSDAKEAADNCSKKHFDVSITMDDGIYVLEITKFRKNGGKGKINVHEDVVW